MLIQTNKKVVPHIVRYCFGSMKQIPREYDNDVYKCSAILLARKAKKVQQLAELASKYIPPGYIAKAPMAAITDDPKTCMVYLNFSPRFNVYSFDKNHNFVQDKNLFNEILRNYKIELTDPRKAIKYSSTFKVFKYLRKREEMPITKWMTRYLKLKEYGWRDDMIRDTAQKIEADRMPGELVLCNSPEDYFVQHQVRAGYSCMFNDPDDKYNYHGAETNQFWNELKKQRMFPSVWYHYNPHMQGVYLKRGEVLVARSFLIREDTKRDFELFGGIYARNEADRLAIQVELSKLGYKAKGQRGYELKTPFRVPGVESSRGIVCPLPHTDDTNKTFFATYHTESNEFEFGPRGKLHIGSTYAYNGYLRAEKAT